VTYEPAAAQPGGQPGGALPYDVKVSAAGRYLAVSLDLLEPTGHANWVYVWDLTRPERPLHRIETPSDTFHVDFSGDGRLLYAAPSRQSDAAGSGLLVHDVRTGELTDRRRDGGQGIELSPDGRTLAYGLGADVFLSDAATGEIRQQLTGSQEPIGRIRFSPDGRLVGAVSDDPAARVWEAESGRLLETIPLEEPAWDLAFDGAGDRLFVPSEGRLLSLDLTGADRYVQRTTAADPDPPPEGFSFRSASPYAPAVAISTWDPDLETPLLRVEDRSTGRTTARLGPSFVGNSSDSHAWSPDGRRFAYGDVNDRLWVVDWRTGETVARRRFPVTQLAYTPDATGILAVRPSGLVMLDARTLRATTAPVSLPDRLINQAEVGPGQDTAVAMTAQDTGAVDGLFTVTNRWLVVNLQTGQTLREGRTPEPASMAVSPDRTRMALAYGDAMEIVDLRTGESTVYTDIGSTASDGGLTFSSDGGLLASTDGADRVSLWDGTTGALLGTVQVGYGGGGAPVFLDGQALLLAYPDGSSYVWDTSPTYALDTACRIVGRGLTREEWRAAFVDRPYVDVCG
jgi:WD40 repeat protein